MTTRRLNRLAITNALFARAMRRRVESQHLAVQVMASERTFALVLDASTTAGWQVLGCQRLAEIGVACPR